jgi:hypothetical protein
MSINKTWNGVVYSIPNTRSESGWETTLSSYLQALADNAATTTFNKQAVRKATTTPVTVSASTDCTIIVDLTGPGASTVNLPAGADKQIFIIVDGKGDASTNNITIDANGSETIEGSLTKVIRLNRECLVLQYSSSAGDWKVIGGYVPNMVGGPASSTDNAIARFDGTTGKLVQNSGATIDDNGRLSLTDTAGAGHILSAAGTSAQVVIGRKTASQGFGFIGADSTDAFKLYSGGTGSDTPTLGSLITAISHTGEVALGPPGNRSFNSGAVTGIYKNCYVTGSGGRNNRLTSTNTGAAIEVQEALTNGSSCIAFFTNKDDDSTSTSAITVGEVFPSGDWRIGPSLMYAGIGTQNNSSSGYGIVDSVVNVTGYSGFTGSNTARQGGVFRLDTRDDSSQPLFSWYARAPGVALGTLTLIGRATNSGAWSNISGGSWGVISDLRLKKNIHNLNNGLSMIMALRPVSYEWIEDQPSEIKPTEHFIAQEVEQVNAKWVREVGDEVVQVNGESVTIEGVKTVHFDASFNATLVKAIQEQQAIIDGLKARIEALENK